MKNASAYEDLNQAMVKLSQGDRKAFDFVFNQAWPQVLAYCYQMAQFLDAEDIAQLTMEKVFFRAAYYRPELSSAMTWILTLATWEIRTKRKRHSRQRTPDLSLFERYESSTPEESYLLQKQKQSFAKFIEDLPENDQRILENAVQGLPINLPGIKDATLRKRKQRLFNRLKRFWKRLHD